MHKTIALFVLLTLPLAGCLEDPASRGLAGAAGGAIVADAFNGNVLTGAVIGGLAFRFLAAESKSDSSHGGEGDESKKVLVIHVVIIT